MEGSFFKYRTDKINFILRELISYFFLQSTLIFQNYTNRMLVFVVRGAALTPTKVDYGVCNKRVHKFVAVAPNDKFCTL